MRTENNMAKGMTTWAMKFLLSERTISNLFECNLFLFCSVIKNRAAKVIYFDGRVYYLSGQF